MNKKQALEVQDVTQMQCRDRRCSARSMSRLVPTSHAQHHPNSYSDLLHSNRWRLTIGRVLFGLGLAAFLVCQLLYSAPLK